MGAKRLNLIEDPPSASSSEEEEEEDDEVTSSKPATLADQSSDSGSESDQDAFTIVPIATKPKDEPSNVESTKPLSSIINPCSAKRPSESEDEAKEAKRSKKIAGGDDAKKQLFQRLFTEEDVIAVLKGMLEYYEKKGLDPSADMNAFYDFVKKMIHTDVTKAQLMDKIRRLRKKFENNAGKGKNGEDRIFSQPHEQISFDLSKQIWGNEGITVKVESASAMLNGKLVENGKASDAMKPELLSSPEEKVEVESEEPKKVGNEKGCRRLGGLLFPVAGLDMIGEENRADLEMKYRKLQIAELELFVKRKELIIERAKLILESYKSEDI